MSARFWKQVGPIALAAATCRAGPEARAKPPAPESAGRRGPA